MALVIADRVRETTASTGTGALTLGGPYSGFQAFSVLGNGNTTYYAVVDSATGNWEVGIGTYTLSGNTLSRDTVLASSNSGLLVPFGAGLKDVICTQPSERAVYAVGTDVVAENNAKVPNSLLANSGITFGSTAQALGSTVSALNGVSVGASTASTGAFTTLTSNSTTTLNGTTVPASSTLVTTTATQTLTNKTLTSPTVAQLVNVGTLTLPTSTDTLVGRATTDTLTNKTISGSNNTLSNIGNASLTNSSIGFTYSGGITGAASAALGGSNALSLSSVPNASLQNSIITFGATAQALGSTVSALNSVSIGASTASTGAFTTLTSNSTTTLNGTTVPASSTLVTTTAAQTLTSKTISGASNTLTVDGTNAVGFRTIPQTSQSAAYTLVLEDSGKHILHPSADTTARTFTIPANSSVAYAVGTAITFVNQNGAGVVTIAITTDTMRLAGAGTTGSRTLAANGVATAIKVTSTEWIISGVGLT